MDSYKSSRIEWIDLAKGVCILLVVFHHVTITSYISQDILLSDFGMFFLRVHEAIGRYLSPLRMPIFFTLSGFLAYKAVVRNQWKDVFINKICLLIYLFILWGTIQWSLVSLLHMYFSSSMDFSQSNNSLYSTSLKGFAVSMIKGSSSLWYLYALAVYFTLTKLLCKQPQIAMVIMLAMHLVGWLFVGEWPSRSILMNGIYFSFGCFFGTRIFHFFNSISLNTVVLVSIPFVLVFITKIFGVTVPLFESMLFVFFGAVFFSLLQRKLPLGLLGWIGRNTLQIYVLHRIFIEVALICLLPSFASENSPLQGFSATWWACLYPTLMSIIIVLSSLLVWSITNRGAGRLLYNLPKSFFKISPRQSCKV
ncbi:hypothetical protein DU002_11130 [Corallincola holothuriorum]|uniref:Acyltransferase 3 domain-containing protein n=1 Tax=Corallincola holothuriorum TaxID=2282215 RepID=A0A368NG80_9GAMM|nr:acyltransferase family protein [Corallincola holothuriorum]RCU49468.1 hypothetical protein DU002_11130 [Corallincola holothuriorum]